jgi:hypothetical protein
MEEHFKPQSDLLVDLVNYGANLLARCFTTSAKGLPEVVVIAVLFKQILSMLDAFEILFTSGSIYPAHLQSRAIFEATLYADFILKADSEKRSKYYYVANMRGDREWALKCVKGTKQKESFDQLVSQFNKDLVEKYAQFEPELAKQAETILKALQGKSYKEVNDAFEKEIKKKNLPHEPSWYVPLGFGSVRQIAREVDRLHEYETFYNFDSEVMHASNFKRHIKLSANKLTFEHIRTLNGIRDSFLTTVSTILSIYRKMLTTYRPDEIKLFNQKYKDKWREPFLGISSVNYNYDKQPVVL